jgi:hypothetical protein
MVGTYAITIEDEEGNAVETVQRTTRVSHPLVGEEVEIDGVLYRVHAVRHDEDGGETIRRYTRPRVFVRMIGRDDLQ